MVRRGSGGGWKIGGDRFNEAKRVPCSFIRGFVYAKSVSQIGLIPKVKAENENKSNLLVLSGK